MGYGAGTRGLTDWAVAFADYFGAAPVEILPGSNGGGHRRDSRILVSKYPNGPRDPDDNSRRQKPGRLDRKCDRGGSGNSNQGPDLGGSGPRDRGFNCVGYGGGGSRVWIEGLTAEVTDVVDQRLEFQTVEVRYLTVGTASNAKQ